MSNIIDSIQLSGIIYQIEGSGGGKAIEAGRGISITTGETADTVSFDLPISAGTGYQSIAEGRNTTASGDYSHAEGSSTKANGSTSHAEGNYAIASGNSSHAEGDHTTANGSYSHAEGRYTEANNNYEHASGQYNVSSSASTTFGDSGNTLFSVGNGTTTSSRHNAFEIRQNGDIYISSGNTDIKLQDHLGGSSITVDTALDSGSTNPVENRVIYNKIDEVEEVTAAGLNALNDKITPTVELTQAQYDALATKDPNTYYIITDAQAGDLTNYYTKSETNTLLGGKQATLVSAVNIKTINNESILGSGNIEIQGGGVDVVQTTGTSTTDVMSQDAVTTQLNGTVKLSNVGTYFISSFSNYTNSLGIVFHRFDVNNTSSGTRIWYGKINGKYTCGFGNPAPSGLMDLSVVETSAITTSVTSSSTDVQVPSAKAVNDKLGGLSLVKLTQAQYDALSPNYDSNTLYVVTDS